jgi:hypothetical protein
MIISCIIVITWTFTKKRPQISLKTLKQDFKELKMNIKGVSNLPDDYKNTILIGYLSIILLFISLFLISFSNLYGGLNEIRKLVD